jgi:hypothetical protein
MPCDSYRTTSVQLENCDKTVLIDTLKELGLYQSHDEDYIYINNNEWVDLKNKRMEIGPNRDLRAIKTAIMKNAVKTKVTKAGFTIEPVQVKKQAQLRIY